MESNSTNSSGDILITVVIVFFIILIIGGCCGGGYYYNSRCKHEPFSNIITDPNNNYNALYTNEYEYTQPPGDTKAQQYSGVGQGTRGEFLPLQGMGAQTYMLNSSRQNTIVPSPNKGKIGGQPNYTTKDYSTAWLGFNNFPLDDSNQMTTNSYLLQGANERVCDPGRKCDSLPSPDWWPSIRKDSKGYNVLGNDLLVTCPEQNINTCPDGKAFTIYKNQTQDKHVLNTINKKI